MKLSDRVERATFSILGLLLLAAGLYTLLRGLGTFGSGASDDPLISASTRRFLGDHEGWWWAAGAAAALLCVLAGLALLRRQLRAVPRRGADPLVRRRDDGVTRVDRGALTGALEDELEHLPDVDRGCGPSRARGYASAGRRAARRCRTTRTSATSAAPWRITRSSGSARPSRPTSWPPRCTSSSPSTVTARFTEGAGSASVPRRWNTPASAAPA